MTTASTALMLSRLLDQFAVSSKLHALLVAIGERFDDGDAMIADLLSSRWIDTAGGVWLDTLGIIAGVARPYAEQTPIFTYRAVGDAENPDKGYSSLADPTSGGKYATSRGLPSATLADDETYRRRIRAKFNAARVAPSIPSIYSWVIATFGDVVDAIESTPGAVVITLSEYLTYSDRVTLRDFAPVGAGIDLVIANWPAEPV